MTSFIESYQKDVAAEFMEDHFSHRNYILIVGDADEIIHRRIASYLRSAYWTFIHPVIYFEMDFFYYNFKWKKKYIWSNSFAITDRFVEELSLYDVRNYRLDRTSIAAAGWHCSYFQSIGDMARKIESFAHQVMCDVNVVCLLLQLAVKISIIIRWKVLSVVTSHM